MRIAVGLNRAEEVGPLAEAGAGEFYAGIVPDTWSSKYGFSLSPNRRETRRPNLTSFDDLACLARAAHAARLPLLLTVNAHDYPLAVLPEIRSLIDRALEAGADGIIVADPGLLLSLYEWRVQTHVTLSGDFGITNARSLDWPVELGIVDRVIFPRQTSVQTMQRIIQRHPGLEYEAFAMNERCFFSGARCYSVHGKLDDNYCTDLLNTPWRLEAAGPIGHDLYESAMAAAAAIKTRQMAAQNCDLPDGKRFRAVPCGLCMLPELVRVGVTRLKVVSRGSDTGLKLLMVRLVRWVLDAEPAADEVIRRYADAFTGYFGEMCERGYNCYYL